MLASFINDSYMFSFVNSLWDFSDLFSLNTALQSQRQYLLTCKVSRYCLFALHGRIIHFAALLLLQPSRDVSQLAFHLFIFVCAWISLPLSFLANIIYLTSNRPPTDCLTEPTNERITDPHMSMLYRTNEQTSERF